MRTWWTPALVLAMIAAPLGEAAVDPFLAGEDPADDAANHIAPGVDLDALVTAERTDIRGLVLGDDDGTLTVKLLIGTTPTGTSGYMYRVRFDHGGTEYFTCWNTQWFGGTQEVENIKGCSRFTSGTQVGPSLKADGVEVGSDGDGSYVLWPVSRADIAGAGVADLENVFADTWFRGVSDCCIGSTTDSRYYWNVADRGPDEGIWDYEVPSAGPADLDVSINVSAVESLALPADFTAEVPFTLAVNGTHDGLNGTIALEGLDWNVTWANATEDGNGTFSVPAGSTNVTVTADLDIPADAADQTFDAAVVATIEGMTTRQNVTFWVVSEPPPGGPPPGDDGGSGNTTGNATDGLLGSDAESPGLGLLVVVGVVAAAVVARRRR